MARIAVIGAGVFGAWTAHHLQAQGHAVVLIDAFGPAHARASSGGETRMIRAAYGKDRIYARMAVESLPHWQALSATAGLPILISHGVLYFFAGDDPCFEDSLAIHRDLGLASQALGPADLTRRFPMINFDGIDAGLFEPDFGTLLARRSVQTLVQQLVVGGGTYVQGAVLPPLDDSDRLTSVRLASGKSIEADGFAFAAGPWLPKLFPKHIGARIRPTRQEIFYFAPPSGDRRFLPASMPGWADFNRGDMVYGFPDIEARGVKFAHDRHGPLVDPDTQSRTPTEAALAEVIAFRDRRFPLLRGAPLIGAEVCQYENSSNGDFLIDRHPGHANVVLVGGGSGHGFKHGPEVGRIAAMLAVSGGPQTEPRFTLATKATTQSRAVH